jgi:hypothetical protein
MPKKKQQLFIWLGVGTAALLGGVFIFKDRIKELVKAPDGTTKITSPASAAPSIPAYTPAQMQTFMKPSTIPSESMTRVMSRISVSVPAAKQKLTLAVKELEKDPDSVAKSHAVKKSLKQLKKAAAKAASRA